MGSGYVFQSCLKTIPLTRGQVTIVDDDVFDEYVQRRVRWCANKKGNRWYAVRFGEGKMLFLHRRIAQAGSGQVVDHINGDTLDNRRSNLRLCEGWQNAHNCGKRKNGASPYKGIKPGYRKDRETWKAEIQVRGQRHYLGEHDTPEEAARAYDVAALRLVGPFAGLNFPAHGLELREAAPQGL